MTVGFINASNNYKFEEMTSQVTEDTRIKLSVLTEKNDNILKLYDSLMKECVHSGISVDDLKRLCDAIEYAAEKHKEQTRKNIEATPYIIHPIGVANIIVNEGGYVDIDTILGAILHDTVEDTDTTYRELSEVFGDTIMGYVKECSDEVNELTGEKVHDKKERKRLQVIHATDMTPRAKLIKLADKLYNLRDMPKDVWPPQRRYEYMEFSENILKSVKLGHYNVDDVQILQAIEMLESILSQEILLVKNELMGLLDL